MSDVIDGVLPALDEKARLAGLSKTVKFDIKGEGAIILSQDGARRSDDDHVDLTVRTSAKTFLGLMEGSVNPTTAFMMGKIKIDGDMGLAMKLGQILG